MGLSLLQSGLYQHRRPKGNFPKRYLPAWSPLSIGCHAGPNWITAEDTTKGLPKAPGGRTGLHGQHPGHAFGTSDRLPTTLPLDGRPQLCLWMADCAAPPDMNRWCGWLGWPRRTTNKMPYDSRMVDSFFYKPSQRRSAKTIKASTATTTNTT